MLCLFWNQGSSSDLSEQRLLDLFSKNWYKKNLFFLSVERKHEFFYVPKLKNNEKKWQTRYMYYIMQ